MTFAEIQPNIAAKIAADATLSPLGAAIQADPFADPEAAKSAIADQLRSTGVCIEVGFPWIGAPETANGGSTLIDGMCEVFVAEHTVKTHEPAKAALVTRVIQAITKPVGVQKPIRLRASESVKTEHGYILHMMSFFVPLNIKQP
jgi:hypothetical protein